MSSSSQISVSQFFWVYVPQEITSLPKIAIEAVKGHQVTKGPSQILSPEDRWSAHHLEGLPKGLQQVNGSFKVSCFILKIVFYHKFTYLNIQIFDTLIYLELKLQEDASYAPSATLHSERTNTESDVLGS